MYEFAISMEWVSFAARWFHVITAIAWIGSSFYFIALDLGLHKHDNLPKGAAGDEWQVHGGGFYHIQKYMIAPEKMPENLVWFKWEAYSTWITGFLLFMLIYYLNANAYLIDSSKASLSQPTSIIISLISILGSWLAYELLCRSSLIEKGLLFGQVILMLITVLVFLLDLIFTDRAAYLHIGIIIGTCMAANVKTVIIPGQKALVAAVEQGKTPDPAYGYKAKLRSIHNNYATLPVLFIMLSHHYPMTYSHEYGWLVLSAITLIAAWTRHFFNLRHRGVIRPSILISALIAFAVLAWIIKPSLSLSSDTPKLSDQAAMSIIQTRCQSCHSLFPTDKTFTTAPAGVVLDTKQQINQWLPRIHARVVISQDMPFMNKTAMTSEERSALTQWLEGKHH